MVTTVSLVGTLCYERSWPQVSKAEYISERTAVPGLSCDSDAADAGEHILRHCSDGGALLVPLLSEAAAT